LFIVLYHMLFLLFYLYYVIANLIKDSNCYDLLACCLTVQGWVPLVELELIPSFLLGFV
jgi:hypothetical protein